MIHGLITLAVCVVAILAKLIIPGISSYLIVLAMGFFAFFYIGREHAQAEYRYIEQYCNRKRANMPWYAAFTVKAWTLKSLLDMLLPVTVFVVGYLIFVFFVIK